MWGFQRVVGATLWYVLVVLRWWHSQFVEPVVTWWLETVLGVGAGRLQLLRQPLASQLAPHGLHLLTRETPRRNLNLHCTALQIKDHSLSGCFRQAWEETVKAFLRESFATATRLLNGASAWTVSIFFGQGYHETTRSSRSRRMRAWKAW